MNDFRVLILEDNLKTVSGLYELFDELEKSITVKYRL